MYPLKCVKIGPNGHLFLDALASSCFLTSPPRPLPPQTFFSDIPRSWLMKSPFTQSKTECFLRFLPPSSSCHQLPLLDLLQPSVRHSVVCDSFQVHGLQSARLLCSWNSPGKNTGVSCHFLLQGIFLTQGSNLGLCIGERTLYHLSHQRSPRNLSKLTLLSDFLASSSPSSLNSSQPPYYLLCGLIKIQF